MTDLLIIAASSLISGGAVYLWMWGRLASARKLIESRTKARDWMEQKADRAERYLTEALVEVAELQAQLTRLTDRDERGRFVRKEPKL